MINGEEVEQVESFKFLGMTISIDLTWGPHILVTCKKAQQQLYFLRQLKMFKVNEEILIQFFRSIIESVLTFSCTIWCYGATEEESDDLKYIVKTAAKIIGCSLSDLDQIFKDRVSRRSKSIMKDPSHPAHGLFNALPSGCRLRSIKTRNQRFRSSCFPTTIRVLNEMKEF